MKKEMEALGEELCNYCPLPEENRGCKSALVNCEGASCVEAYESYKEENEFEDLRKDKKSTNTFRLVFKRGKITVEQWFSDGKEAKKRFYKNSMYWPTLFINDTMLMKKVSEPDISGKLK